MSFTKYLKAWFVIEPFELNESKEERELDILRKTAVLIRWLTLLIALLAIRVGFIIIQGLILGILDLISII